MNDPVRLPNRFAPPIDSRSRTTKILDAGLPLCRFLAALFWLPWVLYEHVPKWLFFYRDMAASEPLPPALSLIKPVSDAIVLHTPLVVGGMCAYTFVYLTAIYLHGWRSRTVLVLDVVHCLMMVLAIAIDVICLSAAETLLAWQALLPR
jgi:hypothetical protein